jgi:tetratricopeptide (TPR) repeat protein
MPKGWKKEEKRTDLSTINSSIICEKCHNECLPNTKYCNICGSNLSVNNNFKSYVLRDYNFLIQYPKDWTFDENINESVKVKFTPEGSKTSYVAIVSAKVQGLTLDQIVGYFNNSYSNSQVIESKAIKIKEMEAYKVIKINDNIQSIEIFFKIDDELITIAFNCFKDDFSNYLSIFEYMINSIDFDLNKYKNINSNTILKENDSNPKLDTIPSNTTNFSKDYKLDSSSINELIYLSTDELEPTIRLEKANNYIKNVPNNGLAWNAKGFALAELEKHDEALKAYDHAIKLDFNCFLAIYNKANLLMRMNHDDKAIKLFAQVLDITDEIISKNPNDFLAWRTKGITLLDLERADNALECLNKAISINSNDNYPWSNKGIALFELGKYYEAIDCYEKAIDLNPRDYNTWNNKAFAYGALEMYDLELECHDKVLELDPTDVHAWNNKAFVLENLERFEEALQCLQQSITIDPNYAETWLRKGEIMLSLQRYYDAKDDFDHAIKIDPTNADAWYKKGSTEIYIGLIDQGLNNLSKAIELGGEEIKNMAQNDKFLVNIKEDPRFNALLK